jgi:hypothetical protein
LDVSQLSAEVRADLDALSRTPSSGQFEAKYEWGNSSKSELVQSFAATHRLFYKVDRVTFDDQSMPAGVSKQAETIAVTQEVAAPARVTRLMFTYFTGDEDKDNDGSDVGATVFFNRLILADGVTQNPGDRDTVWRDESIHGPYSLALGKEVAWSEFDQMAVQVWHSRERGGGPAWRFKVQVDAALTDGTTRRVLDFDDPGQLFTHKPESRRFWSFDLRGPSTGTRYTTPRIALHETPPH